MKRPQHLDHLLSQWVFDPNTLNSRMVKGRDGRDIIQMRVDMGVLQMETTGRPDGAQPNGCETYLDYLQTLLLKDPEHKLNESECGEVDREFMQFYHRRICWLRLQYYSRAVMDADHTLRLMDISDKMSPDEEWTGSHEQYRPFVLFHRTQADSLAKLDDSGPEQAVEAINTGLELIHEFFVRHDAEEHFDEDELVVRLIELRENLRSEYSIGKTLRERLDEAVQQEDYLLAAKLRDELTAREKE